MKSMDPSATCWEQVKAQRRSNAAIRPPILDSRASRRTFLAAHYSRFLAAHIGIAESTREGIANEINERMSSRPLNALLAETGPTFG